MGEPLSLYLKYRPQSLDEVIGNEEVVEVPGPSEKGRSKTVVHEPTGWQDYPDVMCPELESKG